MDVGYVRHFVDTFNRRFGSETPSFSSEQIYLTALSASVPEGAPDSQLLTTIQLQNIKNILHRRWLAIRGGPLDYTYASHKPTNRYFIKLGHELSTALNEPLLTTLMIVDNDRCFNLNASFDTGLLAPSVSYNKKTFKSPELHRLYFHENTLYSIEGLLILNGLLTPGADVRAELQRTRSFSTYTNNTRTEKRALSPQELLNIQSKTAPFCVKIDEKEYTHPYDVLRYIEMPTWRHKGTLPDKAIIQLIAIYLSTTSTTSTTEWKNKLNDWGNALVNNFPIDDVNWLYAHWLNESANYCFIDALFDLLQSSSSSNLYEKMMPIATWLCCTVPPERGSDQIAALFRDHWAKIKDTPDDYLRVRTDYPTPYERLAKGLSGHQVICVDYYRFLIQTLRHETDLVTLLPLTDIPLTDFILSENEQRLINLGSSEENYKENKGFCNVSTSPQRFFEPIEKNRIAHSRFAKEHLAHVYLASENNDSTERLTREMHQALWTFANTCFNLGIALAFDYKKMSEEEREIARRRDDSLADFHTFYRSLSPTERSWLDSHMIARSGYFLSFRGALQEWERGRGAGCLYSFIIGLFPLLIDYDPVTRFREDIEFMDYTALNPSMSYLNKMRASSRKKVYRDYDNITDAEALHRLKIIIVAAMSDPFREKKDSFEFRRAHAFRTYKHSGPAVCKAILAQATPFFREENYKQIKYIYASIIEHVIKPELKKLTLEAESNMKSCSESDSDSDSDSGSLYKFFNHEAALETAAKKSREYKTIAWLGSIMDESLFNEPGAWIAPESLLPSLQRVSRVSSVVIQEQMKEFLKQLEEMNSNTNNLRLKHLIDIESNILCKQFIHALPTTQETRMLNILKQIPPTAGSSENELPPTQSLKG